MIQLQPADSGQRRRFFTFWKQEPNVKKRRRILMLMLMLIRWWVKAKVSFVGGIGNYSLSLSQSPFLHGFKFPFLSIKGSGSQNQKKSGTKAKSSALKFDYSNVPEKVEWVLTDFSQGSWAPFIGDKKVPESSVQEWAAAFTALSSRRSRSDFQI